MTEKAAAYIEYLKSTHSLEISVHLAEKYSYVFFSTEGLNRYNMHTNPYCFYIKSENGRHRKCVKCQAMAVKKCRSCERYVGVCHAGVCEYIRRICVNGETAGFVSVSGYRAETAGFGANKWYDENMKNGGVPVQLLDTVIPPLCIMLEIIISSAAANTSADDIYLHILSYLNEHHADVTLDELSKKFNYSKSYISHMFRKRSGYTLKHYCNLLKIKDARLLLESTKMSVTDVAYSSGFNNFSYFINTFREITGCTPLAYRRGKRYE